MKKFQVLQTSLDNVRSVNVKKIFTSKMIWNDDFWNRQLCATVATWVWSHLWVVVETALMDDSLVATTAATKRPPSCLTITKCELVFEMIPSNFLVDG